MEPHSAYPYGDNWCAYCGLTVIEYINGEKTILADGKTGYIHHGCSQADPDPLPDDPFSEHSGYTP